MMDKSLFSLAIDENDNDEMGLLEPTPIGPKINIVKSLEGQAYPPNAPNSCSFRSSIYQSLCQAESILLPYSTSSSEQGHDVSMYNGRGMKRPSIAHTSFQAPISPKKAKVSLPFAAQDEKDTSCVVAASTRKKLKSGFRKYQLDNWEASFRAMEEFRRDHNHCFVPHKYPENPALSSWVKRQRYQYKLKQEGRYNTLTPQRQSMLAGLGFVWDSHQAIWDERYSVFCQYVEAYGHANVPVNFSDKSLAIWVKCQRRQYKLRLQGRDSSMTPQRIAKLEAVGFVWKPRLGRGSSASTNDS